MEQKHMFTNKMIANLLIPVVLEQLLNSIMGTADTMMVSNVGSAAISAVSLVDSINVLVIQAFSALAAGGAIVCAQYIGQKNVKRANESARQVLFIITAISVVISLICLVFQKPMLRLILDQWRRRSCVRRKFISFTRHCPFRLSQLMIRQHRFSGHRIIRKVRCSFP